MQVVVMLTAEAAAAVRDSSSAPESKQLRDTVARLGVHLTPMHPGATHPILIPYHQIELPTKEAADEAIRALRECPGVEAAYLQAEAGAP